MTPRDDLRALADIAECAHDNRTGGNDYIECTDCGLMWDYRKPGWHSNHGPRKELAERLRALAAAQQTPQEVYDTVVVPIGAAAIRAGWDGRGSLTEWVIARLAHETPAPRPAEGQPIVVEFQNGDRINLGGLVVERSPAPPATTLPDLCGCCELPLGDARDECPHCHVKFAADPGGPTP